jgi:hypothetical protein
MAFWGDLVAKASDGASGVASSFSNFKFDSVGGFVSSVLNVGKAINDMFNKGKPPLYPTFNINDFRSSFSAGDDGTIARNNLFEVIIEPPMAMNSVGKSGGNSSGTASQLLAKRIESTQLPSKTITTTELRTYGPPRKIATGNSYSEIDMTMIISESMAERQFIINWMESIQPSLANGHDGDISYYDDYAGNKSKILIRVYDQDGTSPRLEIKLMEAYPINVNEVNLDWSDNNSYMKMRVKFAYRHFTETYYKKGDPLKDESLLGMLRGFKNDIRNTVTDIRNLRYKFKTETANLKGIRDRLSRDWKGGDPLSRLETLASAPADLLGGLSDSVFKLTDKSQGGSIGSVTDKIGSNFSKYFSF